MLLTGYMLCAITRWVNTTEIQGLRPMQCVCFCLSKLCICLLPLRIWASDDAHIISAGAPRILQALWYSHLAGVKCINGTQLSRLRLSEQALYTLYQNSVMQIKSASH